MANNLAAAYFNFWLSTDKDKEEIERWQNRIQQYIMAKYGKKSANLLSGDETFGRWFRTAHLMLTATLIEALDQKKVEFKVADMVRLYKIFEDRRVLSGSGKSKAGDSLNDVPNPDGKLPEKFADTIKDIYGVALDPKPDSTETATPKKADVKIPTAEPT